MKSSESSSFSSPSSSSLNASTVESFQFSPCHDHRCCMGDGDDCNSYGYHSPSKVRLQHEPADSFLSPEISSEERFSDRRCRQKQTLAQLMNFHACLSDEEEAEEELLLNMRCRSQEQQHKSPKQQQKSLLVQALCGGRKSKTTVPAVAVTKSSAPPLPGGAVVNPLLQRNNASTRRRCNAPSPLRNANNSPGSTCCGRTSNHVVDCTVVRSRSAGNIPSQGEYRAGSHQEFLTKSKSTGAAVYVIHGPNSQLHGPNSPSPSPRGSNSATRRSLSTNSMLHRDRSSNGKSLPSSIPFQSRSNSRRSSLTYSWSNSFQSRNSTSGSRPSFTYSKTWSVNSSSNHSIQSAIDRYQQHKNTEVEHKRRSSFLPYRSALLSLFLPLPSFWSHPHHHIRST